MAAHKRTTIQIARDRREIANLYLKGWLQAEIAKHLNEDAERGYTLSRQMISYDLLRLQEQWKDSALVDIDDLRGRELGEVDHLERTYWEAWERSCENAETVTQKTKGVVQRWQDEDGEFVSERPAEIDKTVKGQTGDPRFLTGVQWCIERRCKILGVDAPVKQEVTGKIDVSDTTPRKSIMRRLFGISEREATNPVPE